MNDHSTELDLLISGGKVVTAASESVMSVGVRDGRVVHLGEDRPAKHVIDATGRLVLPGGIDPHVHLSAGVMPDGELLHWADDYASGTRAAAAGGITTIGDMSYPRIGESLTEMMKRAVADASAHALTDFIIHPIVVNPDDRVRAELRALAADGHTSLKFFMIRDSFDPQSREFTHLLRTAGELGILSMIHCEDGCVCAHQIGHLMEVGRSGVEHYSTSRPEYAEEAAVVRAIALARAANAPLYVVHISTLGALKAIQRARTEGFDVFAETRPLYLYQDDSV
ncbi:MAG TPA: amidohydrolase family protein [Terrimesophilobacter sp.]|nr:amidohydrolase family protein [Terrimesophilobacter sp.]